MRPKHQDCNIWEQEGTQWDAGKETSGWQAVSKAWAATGLQQRGEMWAWGREGFGGNQQKDADLIHLRICRGRLLQICTGQS